MDGSAGTVLPAKIFRLLLHVSILLLPFLIGISAQLTQISGGSVQHQITAYGGQRPVSFQRAISQSPGYGPTPSVYHQETLFQQFLTLANVSSVEEARQLNSSAVIGANQKQMAAGVSYNPTVDGIFVPALPALLLNAGAFAKDVQVMVGHNANEAPGFTPPKTGANYSSEEIALFLPATFVGIQDAVVDTIIEDVYPEIYDGSQPYRDSLHRVMLLISDSGFTCNTYYLNKAFKNLTYAYEFQVPPALHGQDVRYTFYDGGGDNPSQGLIAAIAEVHQAYIVNFALSGNPNGPDLPVFPMQGNNASMNAWNATAVKTERDDTVNERCRWWQKSLFA
jgi:carboxylesterase type B